MNFHWFVATEGPLTKYLHLWDLHWWLHLKNTMTRNYCPAQFCGIKQIKIVLFQKIQRTLNYQKETKCKASNVSEIVIIRLPIQGQHWLKGNDLFWTYLVLGCSDLGGKLKNTEFIQNKTVVEAFSSEDFFFNAASRTKNIYPANIFQTGYFKATLPVAWQSADKGSSPMLSFNFQGHEK